jgi:uncharacterized membrane protein YkoI
VVDAVKARWPDAELKKAEKDVGEDKKPFYEVAFKSKKDSLEVTLTEAGEITIIEKEMDVKDLPKAVTKALEDKYPKGEISEAEEVTKVEGKKEKLAYYEVEVKTADKKELEVEVDPDGKILKENVEASEEKVPLDKVPKAVTDAIKARWPDAELPKQALKEVGEDKKATYEIEFKTKKDELEVTLTEAGEITLIEREMEVKDLPKAVTKALEDKYPKAQLKEADEVTKVEGKKEKLAYYEVELTTADKKKLEVQVDPDGKILNEKGAK